MGRMMMTETPGVLDPDAVGQRLLRFQIAGDSMMPVYRAGMVIECEFLSVEDEIGGKLRIGADYLVVLDGRSFFRRLEKAAGDELHFRAINRREFPSLVSVSLCDVMALAIARGEYVPFGEPDLDVLKKEAASASSIDPSPASIGVNAGKTFAA